jgi:hypothetical protein
VRVHFLRPGSVKLLIQVRMTMIFDLAAVHCCIARITSGRAPLRNHPVLSATAAAHGKGAT